MNTEVAAIIIAAIAALGSVTTALITHKWSLLSKRGVSQNEELISRVGSLELRVDGRLDALLDAVQKLATAQGIEIGRAEGVAQEKEAEKKRSQSIRITE